MEFFSSVKVGVWLISNYTDCICNWNHFSTRDVYSTRVVINQAEHYAKQYGLAGKLYYILGFHDLYSSWWYFLLIASIGVSLVICSLDRVIPLYRALKNQRVTTT